MAQYKMDCEDGFMVTSKSKDEAMNMAAMHVMVMHPEMKTSMNEIKNKIQKE